MHMTTFGHSFMTTDALPHSPTHCHQMAFGGTLLAMLTGAGDTTR